MAGAPPIGLDIGSSSIRAVEVRRSKDDYSLINFGQFPLEPGTVTAGVVQNPGAVTAALKQLWAANKFGTKRVTLAVTNPQLVVRETSIANLPASQMRQALPFQVKEQLPLAVERSLLDFYPLEQPGDNPTVRGLLIAVPKEAVVTLVQAVQKAGLKVKGVDLASFAMLRAASRLDAQVEAIVDIGANITSVVVHADGEPLFVRTLPRGGTEITESIAGRLGLETAEAEAFKCRYGLHGNGNPDAVAALVDAVRPLSSELRSSFTYLASGERQKQVTRISLCGGSALMPGLAEHLQEQLGVAVRYADSAARLRDTRKARERGFDSFVPSAAVSIGLTLGAA
ncbi:pilus assembly protein PilM [Actinoplanes lobatus]|uniref:Pilus assembly protein PilM n=1 Tax=Actinoplanes lobatus TaxID=113568 RepID=A0A7W7MFW5_9ACTN|nr:type IV pilus assembly protein PilM [Actinoplanes lobatus]MBB4748759.1 type IV pilus assembly protein PilM [Actinoplanes lobatus]GGN67208.1 pilus assembly protein PilM [Actinoplanes lobatus]GIE37334.1 pilus assembly protein PilM [Actinoplanes lobatus]